MRKLADVIAGCSQFVVECLVFFLLAFQASLLVGTPPAHSSPALAPIPLQVYVHRTYVFGAQEHVFLVDCHPAIEGDVGMADRNTLGAALGLHTSGAPRIAIVALVRLSGAALSMRGHRLDIVLPAPPAPPFPPSSGFHSPQWLNQHLDGSPKRP